jgi:hypothetical protein
VRFFQQRYQSVVQLHAIARDLVFAAHHRPPESLFGVGHKLKVSSCATRRLTRRSASGKSFFRPPAPRFDCACARWSVPEIGLAPSRVRRFGRQ